MNLFTHQFETPFGEMIIAVDDNGILARLVFPNEYQRWAREIIYKGHTTISQSKRCDVVVTQLEEYFRQERQTFDLPLRPEGTAFQQTVWAALRTIPYGTTITYKELAERIGNPAAVRAVGRANGTNPIPIIIPCHRVIGADGSLTGFGGGLDLKASLLNLEGVQMQHSYPPVKQLSLL